MSNYASVIIAWSSTGDDENLGDETYQAKYAAALERVAKELGGSVNGVIWGCGAGGDTMVCENVAQLCVNHLGPDCIWPAIEKEAPFLINSAEETEAFFKTEDMERYEKPQI